MVRLEIIINDVRGYGDCGGTIIDDKLIVTAAHCLDEATEVRAFLGDHDKAAREQTERMVTTSTFYIHPNYRKLLSGANKFDVAVIEFDDKLIDGNLTSRACLPTSTNLMLDNANCWAAGWGVIWGGYRSTLLKEVNYNV